MALDKEELRRLSPADRIRRLREIEKESKKEIEEAERLIKESEESLRVEEATSDVEIPQPEEVDITKLFGEEEEKLEETVKEEEPKITDEDQVKYEISKVMEYAEHLGEGPASTYTMEKIEGMEENLGNIDYKQVSREIADELNAARNVIYEMKKHVGMR